MKYNFWRFLWDTSDIVYKYTRLRIFAPIEYFYPSFTPWIFGKMIGIKGEEKKCS